MKEYKANLFDYPTICITTNGMVDSKGLAIMGRGVALEAKRRQPDLPKILGDLLKEKGNHVYLLKVGYISFPTKNNWKDNSSLKLIERSCIELVALVNDTWNQITEVALPRPGCGEGGLEWSDVKPILEEYLDDRFYIINF